MLDIVAYLLIKNEENEEGIRLFGRIDVENRSIELHYEVNSVGSIQFRADAFQGKKITFPVKSTDAKIYAVYNCSFFQQTVSFASSEMMGTISGSFERLIRQESPYVEYNHLSFSFEGIEKVFPLQEFEVDRQGYDGAFSISNPAFDTKIYNIDSGIAGSIVSCYSGIPSRPCSEVHISQEKFIEISFENGKTVEELLTVLSRSKKYLEFLLSQEIQLSSIRFTNKRNGDFAEVIVDPILVPHTFIKPISGNPHSYSEEMLFDGLRGWLCNYDRLDRVISIWQKTIYNTNVSEEDVFIWRCQAFELLCMLSDEIKDEAYKHLAPDQSNPNIRNYLAVVSDKYGIAKQFRAFFASVKDTRDKLTHNNPQKTVTEKQVKNAYVLIHHCLIATMSEIMGIQCRLPAFFLIPETEKP